MYLTMRLLIDKKSVDEELFRTYQKIFKEEVVKAKVKREKKGAQANSYSEISNVIDYESKTYILKEARRLLGKRKITDAYVIDPVWGRLSFVFKNDEITLFFGKDFFLPKIKLSLLIRDYQKQHLKSCSMQNARLRKVNKYWYIYLVINKKDPPFVSSDIVMGVDLGVRVPAVCYTSTKKIKFIGNGRYLRYLERSTLAHYKKLAQQKRFNVIKKMNHKLSTQKNHLDHLYAREIVDFAIGCKVGVILIEKLQGIQSSIHEQKCTSAYQWSYYRLQNLLLYKARLAGIKVYYVDPRNTSKKCPICKKLNQPKGREYRCTCGFYSHRDLVGAMNISNSTAVLLEPALNTICTV